MLLKKPSRKNCNSKFTSPSSMLSPFAIRRYVARQLSVTDECEFRKWKFSPINQRSFAFRTTENVHLRNANNSVLDDITMRVCSFREKNDFFRYSAFIFDACRRRHHHHLASIVIVVAVAVYVVFVWAKANKLLRKSTLKGKQREAMCSW